MHSFKRHREVKNDEMLRKSSSFLRPAKRRLKTAVTVTSNNNKISARERLRKEFMSQDAHIRNHAQVNDITIAMDQFAKDFEKEEYPPLPDNFMTEADLSSFQETSSTSSSTMENMEQLILSSLALPAAAAGIKEEPKKTADWIKVCNHVLEVQNENKTVEANPAPFSRIICRIQNWLYVVRYILDRLSAERAIKQARIDMIKQRELMKWAASFYSADAEASFEAKSLLQLVADRMVSEGRIDSAATYCASAIPKSHDFPWERNVPRCLDVAQAVLYAETGNQEGVNKIADQVCLDPYQQPQPLDDPEAEELQPRPCLFLRSLVYAMFPEGARYDITYFAAMRKSSVHPKAASLVHDSGKVVSTGCKSPEEAAWTLRKLGQSLRSAGSIPLRVNPAESTVDNIVASMVLPFFVDLSKLRRQCGSYCTYRPDTFPGAILRMKEVNEAKVLVYKTSAVMPGNKSIDDLRQALKIAVNCAWKARIRDPDSEASVLALSVSAQQVARRLLNGESSYGVVSAAAASAATTMVANDMMYE